MKCKLCGKDLDPFKDDTLAERCWEHSPSNPDRKYEVMEKKDSMMRQKFIYPDVKVLRETGNLVRNSLILETYIRLKHYGRYYLCKCYRDFEIKNGIESEVELISCIKHFYAEIYKYQKLMKVDLKLIIPGHFDPPKRVFELDPDQTPEEERLTPNTSPV